MAAIGSAWATSTWGTVEWAASTWEGPAEATRHTVSMEGRCLTSLDGHTNMEALRTVNAKLTPGDEAVTYTFVKN